MRRGRTVGHGAGVPVPEEIPVLTLLCANAVCGLKLTLKVPAPVNETVGTDKNVPISTITLSVDLKGERILLI
jgi:hypothetical protein